MAGLSASPDGARSARPVILPGATGVYLARADGTAVVQLVGGFAGAPSWSPDGGRIAYPWSNAQYGATDIYVADVAGANRMRLAAAPGSGPQPRLGAALSQVP
ncbi:MAG: hypothetical protein AB1505_28625 [Candidatus Latescibacterota bacterium]